MDVCLVSLVGNSVTVVSPGLVTDFRADSHSQRFPHVMSAESKKNQINLSHTAPHHDNAISLHFTCGAG